MPIYSLKGVTPIVEKGAFVHPEAVLIGDVFVLEGAYVAPHVTMRGDFGRLILGKGANLQEQCCMHGFPQSDTVVEENGHIGHGAILHGCLIKKNAMVGMNSTVLDEAVIGENSIVGAGSLVKSKSLIAPNMLALGSPAKEIRPLTKEEIEWKSLGTGEYHMLADLYRSEGNFTKTQAETQVDFNRPRLKISEYAYKPNSVTKQAK